MEVAERLRRKEIDILLIHEAPYLPRLFPFMRDSIASRAVLEAIRIIKPKLVINGHMHSGGYKTYSFSFGTKYVYIDSSQAEGHYLILKPENKSIIIGVWEEHSILQKYVSYR